MGYILEDIAEVTEPKRLSVAGDTNFVVFGSKTGEGVPAEAALTVTELPESPLVLTDANGGVHTFAPTTEPERVGGSTFYADADLARTAQNIRMALLSDSWVASNFEVSVPVDFSGGSASAGRTLQIVGRGVGREFGFSLSFMGKTQTVLSSSDDSIRGDHDSVVLELDVYTDTGAPLGADDRGKFPGQYATTLQKTYSGRPVWFELNRLFGGTPLFKQIARVGWFDPGTMRDYRFTARRTSYTSEAFYESGVCHVLLGAASGRDMEPYVLNREGVRKLLTNKPRTTYVKGGMAYINFVRGVVDGRVRIVYAAYSGGGKCLGTDYSDEQEMARLSNVNTCALELDRVIDRYPTAGLIRVALELDRKVVSDWMEFDVLPDCLHEAKFLAFVGDLGGWEAVNLDASGKRNIKPNYTYYDRTVTPESSERERVYAVELEETTTVESAPMTDEAAQWLKELARSKYVVDSSWRSILLTEFSLSIDPENKNMQRATIKYRYADERTLY